MGVHVYIEVLLNSQSSFNQTSHDAEHLSLKKNKTVWHT